MPTGIYQRKPFTEEHKKRISNTRKQKFITNGFLNSPETRLKLSQWNKEHIRNSCFKKGHRYFQRRIKNNIDRICVVCGKSYNVFLCRSSLTKCCSKQCLAKYNSLHNIGSNHYGWKGGRIVGTCIICNKKYLIDRYRKNISKFCSRECSNKFNYGPTSHAWKGGISKSPYYKKIQSFKSRLYRYLAGELSVEVIQKVYETNIKKFGELTCYLCLNPIKFGDDSLDHIMPISKGGQNNIENLDIVHRSCNSRKNNKTISEYLLAMR